MKKVSFIILLTFLVGFLMLTSCNTTSSSKETACKVCRVTLTKQTGRVNAKLSQTEGKITVCKECYVIGCNSGYLK